jgi:excisionase family DNA binding protein
MSTRSPLASADEVAKYLGVPVNTIYQWRHKGIGPAGLRVGRYVRFRWEDVEAWVDAQAPGRTA